MTITPQHRAVVFTAIGRVEVQQVVAAPAPLGPHEVRVRPAYAGICGSDLHVLEGRHPLVTPPVIPGHEVTAIIDAVGSAVTTLRPGDWVLLDPLVPCGECDRCAASEHNLCVSARVQGFRVPGAMQSVFVTDENRCHRVPDGLPLDEACVAEPLATCVHAVAMLPPGQRVLVIGAGSIGLLMVLTLRHAGYQCVAAVDPLPAKRARAARAGADVFPPEAVHGVYDAVIDCVAVAATMSQAVDHCRPGGTILVVGVPAGPVEIRLAETQRFERAILGSALYTGCDLDEALRLLDTRAIDGSSFVTSVVGIEDAPRAFALARDPEQVKVLIRL
jgi:2-desacetyl-2-hydroxyethyl bacteriochlorophyllide A dehydrogenase